ncbi:hypothetical protein J2Z21_006936 [Streptomyces griseochromogenes]|uniref:Uncharacterized protein n=1 Tax=Streptomyces griseochromogenes TaxID=68214 RepID=A0ABS4M2P0_9ACTN|nr:DUF6221 family protein [Streptomyces griseochromogenes]MBP2053934.1 hypothetical protein [Streptomyces griseochromogenes]
MSAQEELARFLRARFQEDARVARDAVEGAPGAVWGVLADDIEQVLTSQDGRTTHTPLAQFGADDPVKLLTHVARHDPARVLRDLDAGQALLDEHGVRHGRCRTCTGRERATGHRSPCTTLRLLALPFAGHPDYDASWCP